LIQKEQGNLRCPPFLAPRLADVASRHKSEPTCQKLYTTQSAILKLQKLVF
jgi:hypothetical protein